MGDDSIWKEELSFDRKPKEETGDATPAADAEQPTSLWKKELSPKKSPELNSPKSNTSGVAACHSRRELIVRPPYPTTGRS